LVVIAILGILSGLIIVSMGGAQNSAKTLESRLAWIKWNCGRSLLQHTGTYGQALLELLLFYRNW
jgi:type II secretory pathway pseudopilin PulG